MYSILFKLLELVVHLINESYRVFCIYSEFVVVIGNLVLTVFPLLAIFKLERIIVLGYLVKLEVLRVGVLKLESARLDLFVKLYLAA